jgi:hypothetical protein
MNHVISKEEIEHTTRYIESIGITSFMHLFITQATDLENKGFSFNSEMEPHIVHAWLGQIKTKLNKLEWL